MGFSSFYFIAVSQFTSTCLVVSVLRITGHVKVRGVFGQTFDARFLCVTDSVPRYCMPNPARLPAFHLPIQFLSRGARDGAEERRHEPQPRMSLECGKTIPADPRMDGTHAKWSGLGYLGRVFVCVCVCVCACVCFRHIKNRPGLSTKYLHTSVLFQQTRSIPVVTR